MKRVLIVNKTFPAAGLELLKNKVQYTVVPHLDFEPESLPTIKKELKNVDAIIWNTKHRLTGPLLDLAGPNLKCVSTMSSGTDHIDIHEFEKRQLPLGSTPQVLDDSVADITVGLVIAAARRFKEGVAELESGDCKFGVQWRLGQDIAGSTVGIVGFGGIGQAVLRRLRGFDVKRFLYSGRTDKPEAKALGAERLPIEELLRLSDYVILCCPLTEETRHLINDKTLGIMKQNAVIVNIARGDVIDQDALYRALKENRIFAAGLDVVTPEPIAKDHPLVQLPNCYILPHVGSATIETRNAMARISARNVLLALEGKPMLNPVI
ncbi:glyoxylate reductase/hydroxypyruvate reductase-like [Choristoneura fumiferana]